MSYDFFAQYYDILTDNADYEKRADYYCRLLSLCAVNDGILLDLGCGTGSMSIEAARRGFEVIGVDLSPAMLTRAREKAAEAGLDILWLCQDMCELDLYGTVDAAFCSLDGINHLDDENAVLQAFKSISLFMNRGGAFVFDVNTVHKHRQVLADNAFVFECEEQGLFCTWQNFYNSEDDSVDIALDFFCESGEGVYERASECFTEQAYPLNAIAAMLDKAGFEVVGIYDDMTLDAASEGSERAVFLAKKR